MRQSSLKGIILGSNSSSGVKSLSSFYKPILMIFVAFAGRLAKQRLGRFLVGTHLCVRPNLGRHTGFALQSSSPKGLSLRIRARNPLFHRHCCKIAPLVNIWSILCNLYYKRTNCQPFYAKTASAQYQAQAVFGESFSCEAAHLRRIIRLVCVKFSLPEPIRTWRR